MARTSLIVDGYNVLYLNPQMAATGHLPLEERRRVLVRHLSERATQYDITVVFDGWQNGSSTESTTREAGVRVVYSRLGERADTVIMRLIDRSAPAAIVVTNDTEIRQHAQQAGCQVANPDRLSTTRFTPPVTDEARLRSTKKGPAQRPKRQRGPHPWRF